MPLPSPSLRVWLPRRVVRGFGRLRRGLLWTGLGVCLLTAAEPERVALQLKWQHQFQFAGYYAAQAKGFYREAGLEVDIREARPDTEPVDEVVSGRAQYGVSNSTLLVARQQGRPVVVLAVIFQHSPLVLIARAGDGIGSVQDLMGRRVMLERQAIELLAYLKREGVPPQSLKLQPHSFDPQDLVLGKVDALSAYTTDEPLILEQAGVPFQTFAPRAAGIDFYGDNLFTTEAEIRAHPARVKAFREASLRGWKYAMGHPQELIELILATRGDRHGRAHLLAEARQMEALLRTDLVEVGYMNPGRWRHIADTYAELGILPRNVPLEGFLYDPEARERLLHRRVMLSLTIVLPALGILVFLVGTYLSLNRRLRRALKDQDELTTGLSLSERRFRFIAEHSADVIWSMDLGTRRFTYVSPSVREQLGFSPDEIMARTSAEVLGVETAAMVRAVLAEAIADWTAERQDEQRVLEIDQVHKAGHLVPTEVVMTLHGDAQGGPASVVGVSRDITARRKAEAEMRRAFHDLEQIAGTDLLTHAWNRRRFTEAVDGEMHRSRRYGHPLSLLMVDIDHFKRINDTYGHPEGDRVLRGVADCVRGAMRVSDSLTRWGGEEFIVLMPNTGLLNGMVLAERIREAVAAMNLGGIDRVTASIGVAEYLPANSLVAWVERADRALYRAKHEGRNLVEADPERSGAQLSVDAPEGTFLKLVWSRTYLSGEDEIDAQHEHLFHLANQLLDAALSGRPAAEFADLVDTLLAAVRAHFQAEERILEARGYEDLRAHAALHAELLARAAELQEAFLNDRMSIGSLFQFLAHDVVALHILKADREFFPLVSGQPGR